MRCAWTGPATNIPALIFKRNPFLWGRGRTTLCQSLSDWEAGQWTVARCTQLEEADWPGILCSFGWTSVFFSLFKSELLKAQASFFRLKRTSVGCKKQTLILYCETCLGKVWLFLKGTWLISFLTLLRRLQSCCLESLFYGSGSQLGLINNNKHYNLSRFISDAPTRGLELDPSSAPASEHWRFSTAAQTPRILHRRPVGTWTAGWCLRDSAKTARYGAASIVWLSFF